MLKTILMFYLHSRTLHCQLMKFPKQYQYKHRFGVKVDFKNHQARNMTLDIVSGLPTMDDLLKM